MIKWIEERYIKMSNEHQPHPSGSLLSCEVCCKEIPKSAALTVEGADYVRYFCGVECYQKMISQAAAEKAAADKKSS